MSRSIDYIRRGLGIRLFIRLYSFRREQVGVESVFDVRLGLWHLAFDAIGSAIGLFVLSFHVVYVYVACAKQSSVCRCDKIDHKLLPRLRHPEFEW